MVAFRVYFLDGVNRFTGAENIEADSTSDAILQARGVMRESVQCEIWQGRRLVARVAADEWPE